MKPLRARFHLLALVALIASLALAGCQSHAAPENAPTIIPTRASDPVQLHATATPELTATSPASTATAPVATATLLPVAAPAHTPTVNANATVTALATATPPPPEPASPADTATVAPADDDRPVIVLDPGHDHTTPGALGIEYQVVLHAALIAQEALEAAGYQVFLTRTDNEMSFFDDASLLPPNAADMHPGYGRAYAHASRALQFDPEMIIVLHFNGHPNPDVGGIEIYYCEMGGPQNLELAYIMRDELLVALRSLGFEPPATHVAEDLGVARGARHFPSLGNVYTTENEWVESRYAGIPVVLTEPLYMTNATELALIEDDATHIAIAEAYVRVANAWFGR